MLDDNMQKQNEQMPLIVSELFPSTSPEGGFYYYHHHHKHFNNVIFGGFTFGTPELDILHSVL